MAVQSVKGAKTWEKAEDPIFALENNLPIDFQHYLEHHLSLPLMRIFEPIMRNPKSLLSGWSLHAVASVSVRATQVFSDT